MKPAPKTACHYEVLIHQLGRYETGKVLPFHVVAAAAGAADEAKQRAVVAEMVERGIIRPTDAAVNVDLTPPVAFGAAALAVPDEVTHELNRLRAAADELRADRDAQRGRAELAESRRDALAAEIARYVEENGRLRQACADHAAENAALRADLEALTAPAGPAAPKAAA